MDRERLIQAAEDAIGKQREDDYLIAPGTHADQLAATAPALARMLRKSELSTIARQYEEKDREAIEAQRFFKDTANKANWAVFLTACVSALLLMTGPLPVLTTGSAGKWLQILLGSCGIASGALGSMWLFTIRQGNLLQRWMGARAGAETRRIQYFESVTGRENGGEAASMPLALLQLEYFRRYQLEVQIAFYRTRARDHGSAADRMLKLSAVAIGLASFAIGIGGLLGGVVSPQWVSVAGLGAVATALSAFASAQEATGQDRRNMERYRRTREALESLSGKLDAVRMAAALGEPEPLREFVRAVHEQLSLEHRQWLETSESTMASVARLEEALARVGSKLGASDDAAAGPAGSTPTPRSP